MQIGVIGLGRMGANISRRLMRAGHSTVVWDANAAAVQDLGKDGAPGRRLAAGGGAGAAGQAARGVGHAAAGKITEQTRSRNSAELMTAGDIVIDGGNTYYKDDVRRGEDAGGEGHSLHRLSAPRAACGGWSAATA